MAASVGVQEMAVIPQSQRMARTPGWSYCVAQAALLAAKELPSIYERRAGSTDNIHEADGFPVLGHKSAREWMVVYPVLRIKDCQSTTSVHSLTNTKSSSALAAASES